MCVVVFTASDETKRKMYSSILVVGGGLLFHGAQDFLQHRILNKMPPSFRRVVENVEVITRPKVPNVHTHTQPLVSSHWPSELGSSCLKGKANRAISMELCSFEVIYLLMFDL